MDGRTLLTHSQLAGIWLTGTKLPACIIHADEVETGHMREDQ